jgi:hypothetical protein
MLQLRGHGTFGWFRSYRSIGFVMSSVGVVGGEKNDERAMEKNERAAAVARRENDGRAVRSARPKTALYRVSYPR